MSVNYIDQITDTAGTTHYIAEGVDTRIFTAKCTTAATTADKVVTLDDATGFSLTTGVKVAVTFSVGNSASTPTLNVNNTGAKNICFPTAVNVNSSGDGSTYNTWSASETVIFTYSSSVWVNEGSGLSIYNAYKLANDNKFPSQSGNSGKYLTTNGSAVSWATIDLSSKANLASPTFTGTPAAPTAAAGTNTTQIATTAFVNTALTNKITYGTTDLTAGTSALATGVIYLMYEVDS